MLPVFFLRQGLNPKAIKIVLSISAGKRDKLAAGSSHASNFYFCDYRSPNNIGFCGIVFYFSAGLLFAIATTDLIPEAISMGTEHAHDHPESSTSVTEDHELLEKSAINTRAVFRSVATSSLVIITSSVVKRKTLSFIYVFQAMFGVGSGFFLLLLLEQVLQSSGNAHSHSDHRRDDHDVRNSYSLLNLRILYLL